MTAVDQFRVTIKDHPTNGATFTAQQIVPANGPNQATFTGLNNGTPYDVTVEAHNARGYGAPSTDTVTPSATSVPLAITAPAALPAGQVGATYPQRTMAAVGGTAPYTWSAVTDQPGNFIVTENGNFIVDENGNFIVE